MNQNKTPNKTTQKFIPFSAGFIISKIEIRLNSTTELKNKSLI